ncbi:MAG: hypothetical protein IJ228_06650 [Succinivibrio sp.]|nr:hypothetical protein [Succinivibrio sp.]
MIDFILDLYPYILKFYEWALSDLNTALRYWDAGDPRAKTYLGAFLLKFLCFLVASGASVRWILPWVIKQIKAYRAGHSSRINSTDFQVNNSGQSINGNGSVQQQIGLQQNIIVTSAADPQTRTSTTISQADPEISDLERAKAKFSDDLEQLRSKLDRVMDEDHSLDTFQQLPTIINAAVTSAITELRACSAAFCDDIRLEEFKLNLLKEVDIARQLAINRTEESRKSDYGYYLQYMLDALIIFQNQMLKIINERISELSS